MDKRHEELFRDLMQSIESDSMTCLLDTETIESIERSHAELHERLESDTKRIVSLVELMPDSEDFDNYSPEDRDKLIELAQGIHDYLGWLDKAKFHRDALSLIARSRDILDGFDADTLPRDLYEEYEACLGGFSITKNNHYVIEMFCRLVRAGTYPPKWIMEIISDGFNEYINDPGRDPKRLGRKLGLEGAASGTTNPWQAKKMRSDRAIAFLDMLQLICFFDVSQRRAARAVIIKHQLSESEVTFRKFYTTYFGPWQNEIWTRGRSLLMSPYERTKFISSFPVAARKLIKK